jgi:hypothetical protein
MKENQRLTEVIDNLLEKNNQVEEKPPYTGATSARTVE